MISLDDNKCDMDSVHTNRSEKHHKKKSIMKDYVFWTTYSKTLNKTSFFIKSVTVLG